MKGKLTILLTFFVLTGFGQVRVPNTNTFSLQDVYNAVNDHASPSANLSSCFANANPNYFDPNYNNDSYAPANSMKRFRNYGPSVTIPTVITSFILDVSYTTASIAASVTADGGATVTERGVVYNTTGSPTTNDSKVAASTSGTGNYSVGLTGLSENTDYYVRAYAINSEGTAYGGELDFTTLGTGAIVTTSAVTNITSSTAVLEGVIESSSITIIDYGITVNEDRYPTRGEDVTFSYPYNWETIPTSFPYTFNLNVLNFSSSTTYYVRAWVYDGTIVYYGEERSFTTN